MTTILAGDIGGTKTLLATYRVNGDELIEQRRERYSSAEWHDFSVLLNHFLEPLSDRPQRACLAIAGPVQGDGCNSPTCPGCWRSTPSRTPVPSSTWSW